MAYMSSPYRNANAIANHLMQLILKCQKPSKEAAMLAREWMELENTKRDWRGIPRLSTHKLSEVIAAKKANAKSIDVSSEPFTEIEPLTVTAPPPSTPP